MSQKSVPLLLSVQRMFPENIFTVLLPVNTPFVALKIPLDLFYQRLCKFLSHTG